MCIAQYKSFMEKALKIMKLPNIFSFHDRSGLYN